MILTTRSTSFAVASCCMTTSILRCSLGCLGGFGRLVVQLWCVRGVRGCNRLVHCLAAHPNTYERRDSGLLHRYAVDGIRRLGGRARVVGDDDKLCVALEAVEHADKMTDVLVVKR